MFHKKMNRVFSAVACLSPSWLAIIIYRFLGCYIGKNVKLPVGVYLHARKLSIADEVVFKRFTFMIADVIHIGKRVSIGPFLRAKANSISLDDDVTVGEFVHFSGVVVNPQSKLTFGKRVYCGARTVIDLSRDVSVGDESGIGGCSHIFTHGSWLSVLEGFPVRFSGVTIGAKVWLCWHVFVTAGSKIGDFSIVSPSTVVAGEIPPMSVASGNPMKIVSSEGKHVRKLDTVKRRKMLEIILSEVESALRADGMIRTIYSEDQVKQCSTGEVVFCWFEVSQQIALLFTESCIEWVDMTRRLCAESKSEFCRSIMSKLSDHGIRFESVALSDLDEHHGVLLPKFE